MVKNLDKTTLFKITLFNVCFRYLIGVGMTPKTNDTHPHPWEMGAFAVTHPTKIFSFSCISQLQI